MPTSRNANTMVDGIKTMWTLLIGGCVLAVACNADVTQNFFVDEGVTPDTLIGILNAPSGSQDVFPPPPYIIMADQEAVGSDLFINENTGEIRTKITIDREVTDFYSFMAVPLSGGPNIRVRLAVRDVNDHSPAFKSSMVKIEFSESQPRDTRRSLPPAYDQDVGINTTQRYEIISGNINQVFRLSSRRGRDGTLYLDLEINGVLDRETVENYLLLIEAYDGGNPPRTGRLTVNITLLDDNDNQPLFSESRYYASVLENATIGTILLQVEATDADAGLNGQVSYSINRRLSDGEHIFTVNSQSGVVSLNKALNYEERSTYELVITARDNGTQPLESSSFVYIDVMNVNDQPPKIDVVFLNNASGFVSENVPVGEFIARVSVVDEDAVPGDSKILLNMTGDMEKFDLLSETSSVFMIRVKNALDYEEQSNYTLSLTAFDGGSPPLMSEKLVTLYVNDLNDNAPVFDKSVYQVETSESVENGTVLLHVSASDDDTGDNALLEYFLAEKSESEKIRIDPNTGIVQSAVAWNCGTESMDIVIGVRDHGKPVLSSTAVIRLVFRSDGDTAPVLQRHFYNVSLGAEDARIGNCFLKVEANDSGCSAIGKIHYSFHASWTDDYFQIDSETGEICVFRSLDHVPIPDTQFVVQASGQGNASTSAFVQVRMPPISIFKSNYFITEKFVVNIHNSLPIGAHVVQLNPTEDPVPDTPQELTFVYSMATGNDYRLFEISPASGLIRVAKSLHDHIGDHRLLVDVHETSGKLPIAQLEVLIKVDTQVPYFTSKVYKFSVPEDAAVNTTVGEATILSDYVGSAKFFLGSPGSSLFAVDSLSGIVRTVSFLDREMQSFHVINVVTRVAGRPAEDVCQVIISVNDVDDNGPAFRNSEVTLHVPESAPTGDVIFQAIASDRDSHHRQSPQYRMTSSGNQDHFHLDVNSGILSINKPLDYENTSVHEITIHATETLVSAPKRATMRVRINVLDRNDHSPVFQKALYQVQIPESQAEDDVIVQVKATDADAGKSGKITYQIDGSSNVEHLFGIFPETGEVFLRQQLDREKQDIYTFWVQAVDQGKPPFKAITTVKVTVSDVNDNSPVFTQQTHNFSVFENAKADSFVGKILARDADLGENSQIVYGWKCNDSAFRVNPETGEIFTKKSLDREEIALHTCIATAQDRGQPMRQSTTTVAIAVGDINDHSPVFVVPVEDVIWVSEGEPEGTEILKAIAKDADDGDNARIVFSLSVDEDSRMFSIHPSSGTIRNQVILDHEKQSVFHLTVIATDRGIPPRSTSKPITINVADVNDHRPTFSTSVMTIEITEGTPAGTEIGAVQASDADSGENGRILYSIIRGNVFGAFEIGRTSGKLYTAREVDYELAPSYMLRIRAIDSSTQKPRSSLLVVNIIVIDVNDCAPKFTTESCLFSIPENTAVGTNVWNFTATDGDAGSFGQVFFEIPYQSPQAVFEIHPVTGTLTVDEKIDFERNKEFNFIVTASDRDPVKNHRKSTNMKCRVLIEDENDYAPKFISRNHVRISERVDEGYPVTQMVALDEDSYRNGKVTYEISRGNEDHVFALDPDSGLITVNRTYPNLKARSYSLTIIATDNGVPRLATMHTLTIEVDALGGKFSIFNQSLYEVFIREDTDVGTKILEFSGKEKWSSGVRFNIPEEFLYEKFLVDPQTGDLTVSKQLDREIKDVYSMNIYASNKSNPHQYDFATIVVEILDVNDNAPTFQDTCHGLSVPENKEFGAIHKFIATDPDLEDGGKITYRIENNEAVPKFYISPQDGELSAKSLDREDRAEYTLLVVAEDHGRPSKQTVCKVQIAVLDRNDNAPVFTLASYKVHVPEDVPVGYDVIQVKATDKDMGENARISYSLRNDTLGLLAVNEVTGVVITAKILDYEELSSYWVEISATDNGPLQQLTTKTVLEILVDDVNDNEPQFSRYLYEMKVPQNVAPGQQVAQVSALDKDSGKNSALVYSFAIPQRKFDIHPNTGAITAKQGLRDGNAYRMAVVAKDQGKDVQHSSTGMLDIMVGDAAIPPVQLKFSSPAYIASVMENSRIGTNIVTIKATRTDGKDDTVLYSIADGNAAGVFDINKRTGLVTVRDNSDLDFERHKIFNLTVSAETESGDKLQSFTKLTISVTDENDQAPACSQSKYSSSVYEGNNKGTYVTQLYASDGDSGANSRLTFEIMDGNHDGAFVIDPPYSGIVKTNMVLDREIHDAYRLVIAVKDGGKPQKTGTCTLKINIGDMNDNDPVFPSFDRIYVSEAASVGSVIFTAAANDVDINSELTYFLVHNGNGTFSIDGRSGKITLAAPLDRVRKSSYVLVVEAYDQVHRARTNLTVIVRDENDNAPTFSKADYRAAVPEMTPSGTKILSVTAKDADDGTNAKVRYSIKIAPVDGFRIDEYSGTIYTTKPVVFDPSHPLIQLVVVAEDLGNPKLSSIAAVQIQVTSVNRNAPVFSRTVYSSHISEDAPIGQELLQVSAHDPDAEKNVPSVTYSLQEDTDSVFQLDSQSGKLILIKRLDREGAASFSLKVIASDLEKPVRNTTAEVIITVDDVNDCAPQFNATEYKALISEDVKKGTFVLQVKAADFDRGENGTVTYSLLSGNDEKLFAINPINGVIEVSGDLDYDNTSEYKLFVQARDNNLLLPQSSVALVTIYLQDANDHVPLFPVSHYKESIPENSPIGTEIFTARAHDRDRGMHGKLRYSITSGDGASAFQIDPANGKVTSRGELDYERRQVYNFVVTATDMAGSRADVQVTVNIESRDEFDPKFSQPQYRFYIPPISKKGDFVGQVWATDQDAGSDGRVVYHFNRPSEMFIINATTGVIALAEDIHIDNTSLEADTVAPKRRSSRSVQPEDSAMVFASSGKNNSRSDAAIVTVVFGTPQSEPTVGSFTPAIIGSVGGVAVVIAALLITGMYCLWQKRKKPCTDRYGRSFDMLSFSAYNGARENNGRILEGTANHYHDPTLGPSEISSSGRGSVEDDRVIFGSQYYTAAQNVKPNGFFPKMMPDSGLPESVGEYGQKAPLPSSSNESSVHRFDMEGGYEAEARDMFMCPSDRSSRGSSNQGAGLRYGREFDYDFDIKNGNFDYLKWVPPYSPMAAVYAEIAELPEQRRSPPTAYTRTDSQQKSSSPSVLFSKSSSQTTLPCIMPHYSNTHGIGHVNTEMEQEHRHPVYPLFNGRR